MLWCVDVLELTSHAACIVIGFSPSFTTESEILVGWILPCELRSWNCSLRESIGEYLITFPNHTLFLGTHSQISRFRSSICTIPEIRTEVWPWGPISYCPSQTTPQRLFVLKISSFAVIRQFLRKPLFWRNFGLRVPHGSKLLDPRLERVRSQPDDSCTGTCTMVHFRPRSGFATWSSPPPTPHTIAPTTASNVHCTDQASLDDGGAMWASFLAKMLRSPQTTKGWGGVFRDHRKRKLFSCGKTS